MFLFKEPSMHYRIKHIFEQKLFVSKKPPFSFKGVK